MMYDTSCLCLRGKLAADLLDQLSVDEKVTLTVTGTVRELCSREGLDEVMPASMGDTKKKKKSSPRNYCVEVEVDSAKVNGDK